MGKYNIETRLHYSNRFYHVIESEETNIEIENNNIEIKSTKKVISKPRFSSKQYVKETIQYKKSLVEDIKKVEYKKSKNIMAFFYMGIVFFCMIFLFWSSKEIVFTYLKTNECFFALLNHIAVDSFFVILYYIVMIPFIFLFEIPTKAILIIFDDGEKIYFPYYKYKSEEDVKKIIEDINNISNSLKVENKRKKLNFIIGIIMFVLICNQIVWGYEGYNKIKFKKEQSYIENNIAFNEWYTKEEFVNLEFIRTDNIAGYNIYINKENNEIVKIEEKNVQRENKEYLFVAQKFYFKQNNQYFGIKYTYLGDDAKKSIQHFETNDIEYFKVNKKLFKFKKTHNNIKIYYRVDLFDKDIKEKDRVQFLNKNKVYDFIYSDNNYIEFEKSMFKSFEKKNAYNIDGVNCYIIRVQQVNGPEYGPKYYRYVMFIELDDSKYDGIFVEVDNGINEEHYQEYFDNILEIVD